MTETNDQKKLVKITFSDGRVFSFEIKEDEDTIKINKKDVYGKNVHIY